MKTYYINNPVIHLITKPVKAFVIQRVNDYCLTSSFEIYNGGTTYVLKRWCCCLQCTEFIFYRAYSLKQQYTGSYHNSQSTSICYCFSMLSGEAENTNCIAFDLNHLDIVPIINRTCGEQVNYCSFIKGT